MREFAIVSRLTPAQELELVIGAEAGDPDARRQLVAAFLPAIAGLARHFPVGVGLDREELVQEGVAGLLFAARRFDTSLNTPFWAYASFWVRKSMQELAADLTRPVALSDRAVRGLAQVRAARREHLQRHGVEPTTTELSQATGFSPEQLDSLLAVDRTPRRIEEPLHTDDADITIGDTIADPTAEQSYQQVLDDMEIRGVRDLAAEQLNERERAVIRAHYGIGEPSRTLTQIGSSLGFSAERARQIESAALGKLREALTRSAPLS